MDKNSTSEPDTSLNKDNFGPSLQTLNYLKQFARAYQMDNMAPNFFADVNMN